MNVARLQLRQCSLVQVIGNEHSILFEVFLFWSNAGFFLFLKTYFGALNFVIFCFQGIHSSIYKYPNEFLLLEAQFSDFFGF